MLRTTSAARISTVAISSSTLKWGRPAMLTPLSPLQRSLSSHTSKPGILAKHSTGVVGHERLVILTGDPGGCNESFYTHETPILQLYYSCVRIDYETQLVQCWAYFWTMRECSGDQLYNSHGRSEDIRILAEGGGSQEFCKKRTLSRGDNDNNASESCKNTRAKYNTRAIHDNPTRRTP